MYSKIYSIIFRHQKKEFSLKTTNINATFSPEESERRLESDLKALSSFSSHLAEMEKEMRLLQKTFRIKERGYFTTDEDEKIENLLFRYLGIRDSLWDMVFFYRDYEMHFPNALTQAKGFLTGFGACLHLYYYASLMVQVFLKDPEVIKKLNEGFYKSEIPQGIYNALLESLTKIENLQALSAAWLLYSKEIKIKHSTLSRLISSDPNYKKINDKVEAFYYAAEANIKLILEEKCLLFPEIRNELRHTRIVRYAKKYRKKVKDNLFAVKALLFRNVSRLQLPSAYLISFSKEQKEYIHSLLQPGDIILTYTSGYMSNIFLPGVFKHGITYIGSPEKRRGIGLIPENIPDIPKKDINNVIKAIEKDRLNSGISADLIEAVAEGVIFNNLEHILDTHINRFLVLRPKISDKERICFLTNLFLYLGHGYDFNFDFNDGSHLCCTELIYRSLHKKGNIEFSFTKRMGLITISADDIINYHLNNDVFDFVMLAEEDMEQETRQAKILTKNEGELRLKELMILTNKN